MIVGDLKTVCAGLDLGKGPTDQNAEAACIGSPGLAHQAREGRSPLIAEVAIIGFCTECDVPVIVVTIERLTRDQVDCASKATLDHVGSGVLADNHGTEQFRRNIGKVERLPTDARSESSTPVEFGSHEVEAANHHTGPFGREVIRIARTRKTVDRNAWYALESFSHGSVGQSTNVFCRNCVDNRV